MNLSEPTGSTLDLYYSELDPQKREELLLTYCNENPDDFLNSLRRELLVLRYKDPKDPEHQVDLLLWQCVNLLYVYKTSKMSFFHKGAVKDIEKAKKEMGFDIAKKYGEDGTKELYLEFANALLRYYTTCSGDKSYRKKVFGIVSMQDEEKNRKLALDAWRLSRGIKERYKDAPSLEPFYKAAKDVYFEFEPRADVYFTECNNKYGARL